MDPPYNELGINECLKPGPCVLSLLYYVLLRFLLKIMETIDDIRQTFFGRFSGSDPSLLFTILKIKL